MKLSRQAETEGSIVAGEPSSERMAPQALGAKVETGRLRCQGMFVRSVCLGFS